jgi:hypothetical protein
MKNFLYRCACGLALTTTGTIFSILIFTLIINIMTGCGLVNDWAHSACLTPAEIIWGVK